MITALQQVAEHFTRDPLELLKLQIVSKEFRQVFRSDHVWRYMNVYGVESGICDHFLANLPPEERPLFKLYCRKMSLSTVVNPLAVINRFMVRNNLPPYSQNLYLWLFYLKNGDHDTDGKPFLTPQFYWCAVHWNPSAIALCVDTLQLHQDTYDKALQLDPTTYAYLPLAMRQNRELLLRALKEPKLDGVDNRTLAKKVPPEFHADMEVMRALVKFDPISLVDVLPPRFCKNRELATIAVLNDYNVFDLLPTEMQWDRGIVLAAVTRDGLKLSELEPFCDDMEIVKAAVADRGDALNFASPRLRGSKEVALVAVAQNGLDAQFIDPSLRDDMHVAAVAVKSNYLAVEYFPQVLYHRKLVLQIVKKAPQVVLRLPESLRLDFEFMLKIAKINGSTWPYMHNIMRLKYQIALACIKSFPQLYVSRDFFQAFKDNRGIIKAMLKKTPDMYFDLNRSWRRDPEVMAEYLKGIALSTRKVNLPPALAGAVDDKEPEQPKGVPRRKTRQKKNYKKRKITVKKGRILDEDADENLKQITMEMLAMEGVREHGQQIIGAP